MNCEHPSAAAAQQLDGDEGLVFEGAGKVGRHG
jgi:hypothetical protein